MKRLALATLLLAVAGASLAQVKVTDPWVRGTVASQKSTGAFMQLSSPTATRLVDVSAPDMRVEIHEMSMQGDVMRMKQITGLDLPAGKTVELKPGSYHLMFFNVRHQLKEGDTVPLTLTFENAQKARETVKVQAPVRALNAQVPADMGMKMKEGHSSH
ncbi:copper chaperone PCu(A)C [uncultured Oxalicibacterium sp.]|uniref:copper chaperone PCu(A)C n=1 Tax=uncultured Oxalicibacterium sp. TaxID=1168540 RepID=UPI0025E7B7BB|nr:copper chaperone PCu(A)C [uncultured Oxalicibacterium sp.]